MSTSWPTAVGARPRPLAESEPRRSDGHARRRGGIDGHVSEGAGGCGGRHCEDEPRDRTCAHVAPRPPAARLLGNLPDALRNKANETEDLDVLIALSNGTRAGDYIRLLRGDLHAENGAGDLARAQYELVAKSASPASAEAALRLTALGHSGVAVTDIKKLRAQAGTNCLMCHGK